jgi:hypothetical protein
VITGNTQTIEGNSDARIDSLIALGRASQKPQTIVTTIGAHNKFRFYSEPMYPLKNISPKEFKPNKSFNEYKTELDEFLEGMDSLSSKIKTLEAELSAYKIENCAKVYNFTEQRLTENAEYFYRFFSGNCIGSYRRVSELYIFNDKSLTSDVIKWTGNGCSKLKEKDVQTCSGKTFFIIDWTCKKLDRKIASAVRKKKVTRLLDLDINNRKQFLTAVTGLDDNYFALKEELQRAKNLLSYAKKKYFKTLEKEERESVVGDSYQQFNFIGLLEKDQPNGFGYLLTKDNQIVLSAIWQNGFPVLVYEVNGYHGGKGESFRYRYRPIGNQTGTNKYCIDTQPLRYKDSGTTSFSLYIGEYDQNPSLKWTGYGSCFYDDFKDANLLFYQGYWKQSKRDGNGIYQGNGVFTGVFESDEFKSGTHALTNGEKRQGEFRNWKLQGVGEVISASGTRTRGYYENGNFMKSAEQYQRDLEEERLQQIKREEARIAEENRERLQREEELKKQEALKAKQRANPIVVSTFDFLDNKGLYVGKTVRLIAYYSLKNESSPSNKETYEDRDGQYWDVFCSCWRHKDGGYKSKEYKSSNYKTFELLGSSQKIDVFIPDSFFQNNVMKNSFRDGRLFIDLYVETANKLVLENIGRFE